MNIVQNESIYLSNSEAEIFGKMSRILEGLEKGCMNPTHKHKVRMAIASILEVWNIIEDIQED